MYSMGVANGVNSPYLCSLCIASLCIWVYTFHILSLSDWGCFMAATPKTYIPGILLVANYLKKYLNKHSATLQQYMGNGLYSVLVLVVDLVVILASIISENAPTNENPWSDFNSVATLSSQQINSVSAAYQKFLTTNGIEA